MTALIFESHASFPGEIDSSRIVSLELVAPVEGGTPVLYATTRYDGGICAWELTPSGAVALDDAAHARAAAPGAVPDIAVIETPDGPALLSGGGYGGALMLYPIADDGSLGTPVSLGTVAAFTGDLAGTVTVQLGNGGQAVYGGLTGQSGVGYLVFDSAGRLTKSGVVNAGGTVHDDRVIDMAHAVVAGQDYLFGIDLSDPGVTSWSISPGGALTVADSVSALDGLWVSAPTALEMVEAAGQTFLVAAAAGSSTLSVISVGAGGTLKVTDHVLDDLTSRFASVQALATVQHDGKGYVIAGGADDGVSLFQMLPDGTLLALAHLADSAEMSLASVSDISAQSVDGKIEIYVSSGLETGVTLLSYDPGKAGIELVANAGGSSLTGTGANDMLWGGAGNDRLNGSGGDDILLDGGGSDTLTGGAGADIFVLGTDGKADTITDFDPARDRIDLSSWSMLRDAGQLVMTATATGLTIAYRDELLTVHSASGGPIDPALLGTQALIGVTRIDTSYASSIELKPDFQPPPDPETEIMGTPGPDALTAQTVDCMLSGLAGDDTLIGGNGDDSLDGGDGRDRLDGGLGHDTMAGGLGDDRYIVDSMGDVITGEIGYSKGGGIDTVESWVSYTLTSNLEILRLQGTENLSGAGNGAPEALVGQEGDNKLDGGGGNDVLTAKAGDDTLIGGGGMDQLVADEGADVFVFTSQSDSLPGEENRDFINGFVHGEDRIDLSSIDANTHAAGNQAFDFIGSSSFSGQGAASAGELRYFTWGGGNFNIVEADMDGDGHSDIQIFLNLTHWMTGSDFIL